MRIPFSSVGGSMKQLKKKAAYMAGIDIDTYMYHMYV